MGFLLLFVQNDPYSCVAESSILPFGNSPINWILPPTVKIHNSPYESFLGKKIKRREEIVTILYGRTISAGKYVDVFTSRKFGDVPQTIFFFHITDGKTLSSERNDDKSNAGNADWRTFTYTHPSIYFGRPADVPYGKFGFVFSFFERPTRRIPQCKLKLIIAV